MGGIYGTMLGAYADQFSRMISYHMEPTITGGYGTKTLSKKFRGVVRMYSAPPTAEGIKVHTEARPSNNAVVAKKPFLWTSVAIPAGDFVQYDKEDSDVFRVISENVFSDEAAVIVQGLEKVVGLNGTGSNETAFNTGVGSFS